MKSQGKQKNEIIELQMSSLKIPKIPLFRSTAHRIQRKFNEQFNLNESSLLCDSQPTTADDKRPTWSAKTDFTDRL